MLGTYLVTTFETTIALVRFNRCLLEDWEDRILEARDAQADLSASVFDLRNMIINGKLDK